MDFASIKLGNELQLHHRLCLKRASCSRSLMKRKDKLMLLCKVISPTAYHYYRRVIKG